jgi:hypothetical protein
LPLQEDYSILSPAAEPQAMRAVLTSLEEAHGITPQQLRHAGFRMPPPRVGEENRFQLFNDALNGTLRFPKLLAKIMLHPVPLVRSARQVAKGEWWSMACISIGASPEGRPQWAITVVDSTQKSLLIGTSEVRDHPYHNHLLDSAVVQCTGPPPIDKLKEALFRAILIPTGCGGPSRRPERLCIPWGMMRQYCPALNEFGKQIGIQVGIAAQGVRLPAEDPRYTRSAARGLNPATDDGQRAEISKGAAAVAAKKKKQKKKKK